MHFANGSEQCVELHIAVLCSLLKPKRNGNYSNCMLNALPVLEDIHYCLYYCVSLVFVLPIHRLTALY